MTFMFYHIRHVLMLRSRLLVRVLLVFCAEVFRETDVRQKLVFSHHVIEVFIYHCCAAAVFYSLYKYRVTALCVDVFVHRPVL